MADKRLFEQGSDVDPIGDNRVAHGKAATATSNSTWTRIVVWLKTQFNYLEATNNLSDLNDASAARTNLDVYNTTEVDTSLNLKSDKSNVLELDNTDTYTPTLDYHPSTKKYVDDKLLNVKSISNLGGGSSGAANFLTVDKNWIGIVATNSNRFYKLPESPTDGESVYIKAKNGNTTDVAIVSTAYDDLTADLGLSQRDSIFFVAQGGIWQHSAYNNSL